MRFLKDPAFFLLIIFNLYLIWYYGQNPAGFVTLVWLYWVQSVLIGLINAVELSMVRSVKPGSFKMNDQEVTGKSGERGCVSLFFLMHFGIFHVVYAIFILVQVRGKFDGKFFLLAIGLLFIEMTMGVIRRAVWRAENVNIGKMFFMPYLRIIPMHLMILGPAFLGWSNITVFLWLKTITDALMHIFTASNRKPGNSTVINTSQ